jgi:hypothetical protein
VPFIIPFATKIYTKSAKKTLVTPKKPLDNVIKSGEEA